MTLIDPAHIERTGDPTPVRTLSQFVWRMSARHQVYIVLLALAVAGLSMAPLELQRRLINDAIGGSDMDLLVFLAALYLGVLVLQGAMKYALRLYQGWIAESTIRHCRHHLFSVHRERRSEQPEEENGDGQAVSIIGAEVEQLGGFVGEALSSPAVNGGMLLALFGYMLWVEPMIAGIAICFFLPQVLTVPWIQKHLNRLIDRRISMLRDLGDLIADDDPKHCDDEPEELKPSLTGIYRNRMKFFAWKFAGKALVNLLNALAPLSVLVIGGYLAVEGATTIGVVVAFITGFERMASPMTELIAYYRLAQQMRVKHDKIAAWL